ncbi:MAG: redoxin family protein [Sphingomonadales bacterium]|nr:redoxin family protein [Sphingomonadales bacterium]
MKRGLIVWLPLALGLALMAGLYLGLRKPEGHVIASRLVGQTLPEFTTRPVLPGQPPSASADFRDGRPRLLNIFASWCVPCRDEAEMLVRLKAQGVEIDGIAVHDDVDALTTFVAANGNPYRHLGIDEAGRAQMAFGSSGVPETFVIDGRGRILYQHIGAVTEDDGRKLIAMLEHAR